MPIHEYACAKCHEEFEEIVFSADEVVPCPKCGSDETQKLMSCCRSKVGCDGFGQSTGAPSSSASGCAGCSGGNCASCG